eukprot:scaffold82819_cov70-Phaeocystis_antarctica.AAC.5
MNTPPNPPNPVNEYEVNGAIFIHSHSFTSIHLCTGGLRTAQCRRPSRTTPVRGPPPARNKATSAVRVLTAVQAEGQGVG